MLLRELRYPEFGPSSVVLPLVFAIAGLSCGGSKQAEPVAGDLAQAARTELSQDELEDLAEHLRVRYSVLTNRSEGKCKEKEPCFAVEIQLSSDVDLPGDDWELYFSQYFPVRAFESDHFDYEMLEGDLKRIRPRDEFQGFKAGEVYRVVAHHKGDQFVELKAYSNYYVVAEGLEPRVVKSTVSTFDPETGLERLPHLVPYTNYEKQYRSRPSDQIQWATAEYLFEKNADLSVDLTGVDRAIIPTPSRIKPAARSARLNLAAGFNLVLQGFERAQLEAGLKRVERFGFRENSESNANKLLVKRVPATAGFGSEEYKLDVQPKSVTIAARTGAAAFYGLQSLAGLITVGQDTMPTVKVHDKPRFSFRGIHLDVVRNFLPKEFLFRFLEQMAAYKLNRLHLHLGDDEGWRVEIPGLPELTEVGGKRCHDLSEDRCILPQLGSGPHEDAPVNGYLSTAEYQELLRMAKAHHIRVIPSFDMPGHSRAAVKSMEARYRRLMQAGQPEEAARYLLSDLEDKTVYRSIQNYSDNTINVCMESAYVFFEKVISEMQRLHAEAEHPLKRYHIGADETSGAWEQSPKCKAFLAEDNQVNDVEELGRYFVERVAGILDVKGIEIGGWSDGMGRSRPAKMPKVVHSNAWGLLQGNAHKDAHKHANQGWDVVISVPDATYFDMPHEPDPKERGFDWASRYTNSRKVFEFMPENLPIHAEFWPNLASQPFRVDDTVQKNEQGEATHRPLKKGSSFVGLQGQVWTEVIRTPDQAEHMVFPRLLSLAERAWHRADWEVPYDHRGAVFDRNSGRFTQKMREVRDRSWNRFANVVAAKEFPKMDLLDLKYRIPTVGAKVVDGKLVANILFPGLGIEYSVDGGDWKPYEGDVTVDPSSEIRVRAHSPDGSRKGRSLTLGFDP